MIGRYLILSLLLASAVGCRPGPLNEVNPRLSGQMPRKIVWAWERAENLRFLDPREFGVAFLAETLFLANDSVALKGRKQPLDVAPGAYLIAVTRIETERDTFRRPSFDAAMVAQTAKLIRATLEKPDVRAVQVDFDAMASERTFYRAMLTELKRQLPAETPLTMTSLASWCTGDAWFNDFPVDEAVPMVFVMGSDSDKVRNYLRNGNDWHEPLCRGSYGVAVEEPFEGMKPDRRVYYFKNSPWEAADLDRLR